MRTEQWTRREGEATPAKAMEAVHSRRRKKLREVAHWTEASPKWDVGWARMADIPRNPDLLLGRERRFMQPHVAPSELCAPHPGMGMQTRGVAGIIDFARLQSKPSGGRGEVRHSMADSSFMVSAIDVPGDWRRFVPDSPAACMGQAVSTGSLPSKCFRESAA